MKRNSTLGRRYSRSVSGRLGWNAKYIKEVDAHEQIVFFRQEIYNEYGVLVEIHKIYPEDTGHHKV